MYYDKKALDEINKVYSCYSDNLRKAEEEYADAKEMLNEFVKTLPKGLMVDKDSNAITQRHQDIYDKLNSCKKPIVFTYGLAYRHPTTYRVPKTLTEAIEIVDEGSYAMIDIHEEDEVIHLNAYSGNDMW